MGGFEGTAPDHVYKRWLAFGLLSTHSRLHGSDSYRVPWLFGDEAVDVCRAFTKLKLSLMPYLYGLAVEANQEGVPAMRAMVLEFPGDLGAEDCDRQYMLGDALMVAPVLRQDNVGEYYLPRGTWTEYFSGKETEEYGWHSEAYDFFSLPLYVRQNTLLPIGQCDSCADYAYEENVLMQVYALKDTAERTVYNRNGEKAFAVKAVKENETFRFAVDGKAEGLKLQLMGIENVKNVEGAEIVKNEKGLILNVLSNTVVVTL